MTSPLPALQQALALSEQLLGCLDAEQLDQAQRLGKQRDVILRQALAQLGNQQMADEACQALIGKIMTLDHRLKEASDALAQKLEKPAATNPAAGKQAQERKYQKRAKAYADTSKPVKKA